jgi:predicted ribosome quality control (RQC) complex YloA/Tae2 family protein
MKLSHLKQISTYLKKFTKISAIYRVSDSIVKIAFDKNDEIYFDMQRSNSKIFRCESYTRSKIYNAPFDVLLSKRFNRSNILSMELLNDDKILRLKTSIASAYKEEITFVQFEFTGKYTNIILLDKQNIVLEALRHVDLFSSFREVRVGKTLLDVLVAPFEAKEYILKDVEEFLYNEYATDLAQKLQNLKKQKVIFLNKKLKKLEKLYANLDDEQKLEQQKEKFQHFGNLILTNIHKIKPYANILELEDYDGKSIQINLEKEFSSVSSMANHYFTRSKKAKQKASHLYIEKESLESKIKHIKFFISTVQNAKDIAKIQLLFPKVLQAKKLKRNDSIEVFWIDGYKISLGKNEKGNIELLKNARAKDIWIHLKDRPSCHVIITTDKQNIPINIIKGAGLLCVNFSTIQKDRFLVDYTPRREVSIQHGANVLYNKYKTMEIDAR